MTQPPCSAPSSIPGAQGGPHGGVSLRLAGTGNKQELEAIQSQDRGEEQEYTKDRSSWQQLQADPAAIQISTGQSQEARGLPLGCLQGFYPLDDLVYGELLCVRELPV